MKNLRLILLQGLLFMFSKGISQPSDNSYACLGNGRYCVYESGADITDLFGPPYSSPAFITMKTSKDGITVNSIRETGAAIWHHTIMKNEKKIGEIVDFVDSESPALIRKINTSESFTISINIWDYPEILKIDNSKIYPEVKSSLLVRKAPGLYIMQSYHHPYEQYHQIFINGNATLKATAKKDFYDVVINPGESIIYCIGGPSYEECTIHSGNILKLSWNDLYSRTRKYWDNFTSRRIDFAKIIPDKNTDKKQFLKAVDDISILLKTQQASEGSVLAGSAYHMGYVRDQYGVSRGFLALGYYEEAKAILNFYWQIWKKHHVIHNAQAIGVDGIFHIHENDETEITGYLVIQAFDYFEKTKDISFITEIFPMLKWAFEAQKRNLIKDMLPFNGDETYVAGGILPRSALNDGSAEASLLFIDGSQKLLDFASEQKLMSMDFIKSDKILVNSVKEKYHSNFFENGKMMTNAPARRDGIEMPKFRRGVCEGHGYLGQTQRNDNGRYLCPECFVTKHDMPAAPAIKYYLPSISITPLYISSQTISREEIKYNLKEIMDLYEKSGMVTSRPGSSTTIGYEYGLLLYTMIEFNHPKAKEIYGKMMNAIDASGAWVEYYENGKPTGCRYRPWESAINIEAAIKFMMWSK